MIFQREEPSPLACDCAGTIVRANLVQLFLMESYVALCSCKKTFSGKGLAKHVDSKFLKAPIQNI